MDHASDEDALRRLALFWTLLTCATSLVECSPNATVTRAFVAPSPALAVARPVIQVRGKSYPSDASTTAASELTLEDFRIKGEKTYDAAWMRAIAALPAAGGVIALKAATTYEFSDSMALDRGGVALRCTGYQTCVINFAHANDGLAINVKPPVSTTLTTKTGSPAAILASADGISAGMQVKSTNVPAATTISNISGTTAKLSANATADGDIDATFGHVVYNISLDGIVFTRSLRTSSGCDINIVNAAHVEIKNLRIFGKDNSWRGVCLRSATKIVMDEAMIENTQDSNVLIEGGTGRFSSLDGGTINIEIDRGDFFGAHSKTTSPIQGRRGAIQLGENVSGVFLRSTRVQTFRGYAISLDGTSRPRGAVNNLVFILDPNIGATRHGAGGISIHNYANITITHGWFGGKSASALRVDGDSSGVLVTGAALYMDGNATDFAVECAASRLMLTGIDLAAYKPGLRAVDIGPGCDGLNIAGGFIRQFEGGIWNNSTKNPQISINGVQFSHVAREFGPTVEALGNLAVCGNSNASGPMPCYAGTQISAHSKSQPASLPEGGACTVLGLRSFANNLAGERFTFGAVAVSGGERVGPIWCDGKLWREG